MSTQSHVDILLVEDNEQDAELALRTLHKQRLTGRVHWVKDGAEALDCFFAPGTDAGSGGPLTPKVIFLDLKLPKVDGLDVLRRLKADPRTRAIPVVVLTSSREESDVVASYGLGGEQLHRQASRVRQIHRSGGPTGPVLAAPQRTAQPPAGGLTMSIRFLTTGDRATHKVALRSAGLRPAARK